LRILTARPTPAEETRAAHRLYGVLPADRPSSAGPGLELAGRALDEARGGGRGAVGVGGPGRYLHARLHGLAPVPAIPAAVRAAARARHAELGGAAFHAELATIDPDMAARLRPNDRQRLMRAYEVHLATGRSLLDWQRSRASPVPIPEARVLLALVPPRAALYARIERRLHAMVEAGALDELEGLRARRLDPGLPLMKAVAVPELLTHLEGRLDLATALARATMQTRRYAKRQLTWLRHQLPELTPIEGFGEDAGDEALRRVERVALVDQACFPA
jgi:tRNA dimethylallyltransferase